MFGIRNAAVSLPADRFMEGAATAMAGGSGAQDEDEELSPAEQPGSAAGRKTIHLTSDEEMYAEIRDKNFNAVGPYLSREGLVSIETKTRRGQTSIAFSSSILFSPTFYVFQQHSKLFSIEPLRPPRKAKSLSAQDEKRKTANTVRELKTFVDSLPQMMAMKQSLATHTSVAEQVKEETERRQFLEFLQAEQELLNFQGRTSLISWILEEDFKGTT